MNTIFYYKFIGLFYEKSEDNVLLFKTNFSLIRFSKMDQLLNKLTEKIRSSNIDINNTNPLFFRVKNEAERQRFEDIIDNNPSIELHDGIHQQLIELLAIRNIDQNKNLPVLEKFVEKHLNGTPHEEYGVWVYYSWLNKAVHLLDKDEFIEVRTNRNQHKITKEETSDLSSKRIGIIGLSVGQSIASTLVLERCCGEIRLADFDDLELSNLNRIKTGVYNLGIKKIVQIAREIAELDPFIKIVCFEDGITENNIDDFLNKNGKLDLLIEECDGLDIKILSRIKAKQYGIPVVMETNDRGMIDIERYDLNPDAPLLHGILEGISWENLKQLTTEQKIPVMMKLVGFNTVSPRGKLTLLELGQSLSTWPQLASNVVLGAGITTDVARRILLNHLSVSGRFYIDTESIIADKEPKIPSYVHPLLNKMSANDMKTIADNIVVTHAENQFQPSLNIIEKIVTDAGMAPSSGNDQPWQFLYHNGKLFLFYEKERSYSFGNYKDRAAYISLGATIENAVLSAHFQNLEVSVTLFPESNEKDCIAVFVFTSSPEVSSEKHENDVLYNFIEKRYTSRKIAANEVASQTVLEQLTLAAESIPSAKAFFVTDKSSLQTLGAIISESDRIRLMHPRGNYEFFNREMRWTAAEAEKTRSGMDASALEFTPQIMMALQLLRDDSIMNVLRSINGLQGFKGTSIPNAVNAAAMGFITMPSFDAIDFINGGRSVQRQWLKATELGYVLQPLMMPLYLFYRNVFGAGEDLGIPVNKEVHDLRRRFLQIFPGSNERGEIWLFRIAKAQEAEKRSLRLPLSEILFT